MSAEWWREYRRRKRERLTAQQAERRKRKPRTRGDRTAEYAKRNAARERPEVSPLPPVYPELRHGTRVAFWSEELRNDMAQEYALARWQGLPESEARRAARAYRARQLNRFRTVSLDRLPDHVLEIAVPLGGWVGRGRGDLQMAACHARRMVGNGLCGSCSKWAQHQRELLASGKRSAEEIRALVSARARQGTGPDP